MISTTNRLPGDTREWIEPDIKLSLSSADFFANRDPLLEKFLTDVDQKREGGRGKGEEGRANAKRKAMFVTTCLLPLPASRFPLPSSLFPLPPSPSSSSPFPSYQFPCSPITSIARTSRSDAWRQFVCAARCAAAALPVRIASTIASCSDPAVGTVSSNNAMYMRM